MKSALLTIAFTLAAAPAFAASCTQLPFSDPKSVMGAMIQCSDGSTYTYRENPVLGGTVTNDRTLDILYSNNIFPGPAKPMVETFTSPTTGSNFTITRH